MAEEKKKSKQPAETHQKYRLLVLQHLQQGTQELKQIVDSVDLTEEEAVIATIRKMLDNGELVYDNARRLVQPHMLQSQ